MRLLVHIYLHLLFILLNAKTTVDYKFALFFFILLARFLRSLTFIEWTWVSSQINKHKGRLVGGGGTLATK